MAKFIVEFHYSVDRPGRDPYHHAHADYLHSLADQGVLLLGGPVAGENTGLLFYEVDDREHLQRVLDEEPYIAAGIVAEVRVRSWEPGKGSWITKLAQPAT